MRKQRLEIEMPNGTIEAFTNDETDNWEVKDDHLLFYCGVMDEDDEVHTFPVVSKRKWCIPNKDYRLFGHLIDRSYAEEHYGFAVPPHWKNVVLATRMEVMRDTYWEETSGRRLRG